MNNISGMVLLQQRELGNSAFSLPSSINPKDDLSPSRFSNFSNNYIQSSSRTIWISGRENMTLTLNSHGQLIAYNMLDLSKSFAVTKASEHCFKCFFARDCLFLAVRESPSDFVDFFEVSLETLQSSSDERKRLMPGLKITQSMIKEIDPVTLKLVAEKDGNIQVWDFFQNMCIAFFPINQSIQYQVTSEFFVFWETCKSDTKIGVLKFDRSFSVQFTVISNQQIYLCKVVDDELILGFSGCNLQVVNLKTMSSRVIKKGVPIKYYELEKTGKPFFMFSDYSCILNIQDDQVFQVPESQDHYITELSESLIICGSDGHLGILTSSFSSLHVQFSEVQQIGSNPDSGQIFVACKGNFWVIE